MHHLFVINPAAGKRMDTERLTREICQLMADRAESWEIFLTKGPGDAEALSRACAQRHPGGLRVYSLGATAP